MAQPEAMDARKCLLKVGDGSTTTETFTALGALTTRDFNWSVDAKENYVPDTTTPDTVVPILRYAVSQDVTISGDAVLYKQLHTTIRNAMGVSKNWRFDFRNASDTNTGYYKGAFIMTDFKAAGGDGDVFKASLTLKANGGVTWVAET